MLFGQKLGGGHQQRLKPVFNGSKSGAPGDDSLAGTHIPLDKTLHRLRGSHVLVYLLQDTLLALS
jgi:hypothetical protein